MKIRDIYNAINTLAPFDTCLEDDSVGLLVGDMDTAVSRVAVALDVTRATVSAAKDAGAQLLLTHHPAYFGAIDEQPSGCAAFLARDLGLAIISAHTNLDAADGGVNDCLAAALGLLSVEKLSDGSDNVPMARVGELKADSAAALAEYAKTRLGVCGVKLTDCGQAITRVAVCGGSGGDFLDAAKAAHAQALLTGESKHHLRLHAREIGVSLLECGHFCTEQVVKGKLAETVRALGVEAVMLSERDPADYI